MARAPALLLAALSASALAACSPSPCTSCLAVSGDYRETIVSANIGCGDQQSLSFTGGDDRTSVTQTGDALKLTGIMGMDGTLHADGSASFGPIPAQAEPVDGDGNPDGSGSPIQGKLSLDGWFTSRDGQVDAFEGTYFFVADNDGCELDARATWSR